MPKPVAHPDRYVPGLDGLRTIAVLLVVGYHLGLPGFAGGLLGVGVFFTLSGYLITLNLARGYFERGEIDLTTFWIRRFRRLMPVMVLTVIVVLLLTAAFDGPNMAARSLEALSSVLYLNNWYNIAQGNSYFDMFTGLGPLDHMWSLSIEEQFYVLWPLVLVALFFLLRKSSLVVGGTLLLAAASFGLMGDLFEPSLDQTRIYEGTDTRAGALLCGAALAIVVAHRRSKGRSTAVPEWLAVVLGFIGLIAIIAMGIFVDRNAAFLYPWGFILLTLATVCVIVAVISPLSIWAKALGATPTRWMGERSYGIYLWHMPVIYFMPRVWHTEQLWLSALFVLLVSTLLAALSWSIFEDPIRKEGFFTHFKRAKTQREALFPVSMGATVAMASTVLIGLPAAIGANAGQPQTGSANTAMTLEGGGERVTREQPDKEQKKSDIPDEETWGKQPADTRTACAEVIHVGDSTSIGMFSEVQLPPETPDASERYLDAGAGSVLDSVFGARATTVGWDGEGTHFPSATESVAEIKAQGTGEGVCWVIATGVNDAANAAAARSYGYDTTGEIEANIREMMELIDGDRVMWPTAATGSPINEFYSNENMGEFNAALRKVAKDYPNLVIYDWAVEVADHPDWFLEGDEVHYNATGNDERGLRFAAALKKAFPSGVDEKTRPVGTEVRSGL